MMIPLQLTEGAKRMLDTDPHGWTLSLIAVTTVFTALVILYFIYTFTGNIFTGKYKKERKPKAPKQVKGAAGDEAEVAAAIAMAFEAESGSEVEVAIATALHLYLSGSIHDVEPGIITIKRGPAAWAQKNNFRKTPVK